jgi:hypothetical protein
MTAKHAKCMKRDVTSCLDICHISRYKHVILPKGHRFGTV